MTCKEFLQELTDYLDGTIDLKVRAELEEHLHWCHNCFVVLDTTRHTIEIYRNNEVYSLPDDLRGKLQKAIIGKCRNVKRGKST